MAQILALLHRPTSNPGLVGAQLEAAGHELVLCRPLHGDRLPSFRSFLATVILGGPQHAHDPCPHLQAELAWITRAMAQGHALFGICLGAQLIAKALGARVFADPQGRVECGYAPITPEPGNPWLAEPRSVYHWHRDGFDLPAGAQLIARGHGAFPIQAFAHGAALGMQFHPEITTPIMEHWLIRDHGDLALPGACPAAEHRQGHARFAQGNADWLAAVLQRWLPVDQP